MADKRIVTVDYLNSEGLNKDYINNTFANALKGSKRGSAILIDDVSPVPHEMGVKVRGKNLLPYPFAYETFKSNGITFRDNKDGTITLKGRNNGIAISNYNIFTTSDKLSFLKPNTDYYLSCNLDNIIRSLRTVKSDGTYTYYTYGNINFPPDETPDRLFIQVKTDNTTTYDNTVVKLQIELGTTATTYTPYVPDLTAVKVSRCGKNLLSAMSLFPTVTNNAVPIHFKAGQKYTISFTTTYTAWRLMFFGTDKNGTAFDASSANTSKYISETYTGTTGRLQLSGNRTGNIFTFTCNEDCIITAIVFWNAANETNKTYSDFQLELGTTKTYYEPYKECAEYTPTADGTVEGVTSLYPTTTLITDTEGVIIDCEYNRDINKAFAELQQAIISLGGNV